MRRYWGTLVLAIIAVLLGLYVAFVDNPRERARLEAQDRDNRVLALKEEDVVAVEIEAPSDHLVLERTDGGVWRVTSPITADADDGTVRRLLTQITTMSVVRAIDQVDDETNLGLVNPALRVTARRSDGGRANVAFGDANPIGGDVYVKRDDGRIFLVAAAAKSTFDVSRDEVRRKEFIAFRPESVTEIAITRHKRVVRLRRDGGEWRMLKPDRTADPETVSSLMSRLRALRATGFVDVAEQRRALRLDGEPRLEVTLTSSERAVAIAFFGAADGSLYVQTDGETLYRVNERVVQEMPLDATAFRDMRLVRVPFDDVRAVEVEQGGIPYRATRGATGWEMDGRQVEPAAGESIDAMIRAFTTLRGETVAAETLASAPPSFGFAVPAARVTLRGDDARVLSIITIGGAIGDGRYAYSGSNGPVFVISSHALEQVPPKSKFDVTTPPSG
ncbi:MAG: DUF4340 domain-containing protein [Nitrospirota bacterium]